MDSANSNNGGPYNNDMGGGSLNTIAFVSPNEDFKIRVPNITIADFYDSFLKMFNMVVWSDDGLEYFYQTYQEWKASASDLNVSNYIDITSYVKRTAQMPKNFNFKHEDTQQINNVGFTQYNGYQYGNNILYTDGGGNDVNITTKFSTPLWEMIEDKFLCMYAYDVDFVRVLDEQFIFYYSGDEDISANPIDFSGWSAPINTYKVCNNFYPLNAYTDSILWKEEVDPLTSATVATSLYTKWYSDYYGIILDKQARIHTYSAYLPPSILYDLTADDNLIIGDELFLVNDFKVNLVTGKVDFNVFNINPSIPDPLPPPVDKTPPNIGALSVNCDTYALTWTAATDNVGVVEYQIYQASTLNATFVEVGTTTGLTYTPTNLTPNTKYYWRITATDAEGNKSLTSNVVSCWSVLGFEYNLQTTI